MGSESQLLISGLTGHEFGKRVNQDLANSQPLFSCRCRPDAKSCKDSCEHNESECAE